MTLFVSLFILLIITMVVIYTSNSVIIDQRISANAYRSHQAMAYTQGSMNYAAAFVNTNGLFPQQLTGYQNDMQIENVIMNQPHFSHSFSNATALWLESHTLDLSDGSDCSGSPLICSSERMVRQSFTRVPLIKQGIYQPLISHSDIDFTGNMKVINRYSHINIWSADKVKAGHSHAAKSYLLIPGTDTSDYSEADFISASSHTGDLIQMSGKKTANGVDIIEFDISLSQLTKEQFFINFMNESKRNIKTMAEDEGHFFSDFDQLDSFYFSHDKGNLIWVGNGSDLTMNEDTYGSINNPVILIVDVREGVFKSRGNPIIFGLLYIMGDWQSSGNITIKGAVIIEGKVKKTTGNSTIVYSPSLASGGISLLGNTAKVSGSWKDF